MAHQEFGVRLIERVRNDLEAIAVVEQWPKMEGRQLIMVLSPKKAVVPPVKKKAAARAKKADTAEKKPDAAAKKSDTAIS